MQDKAAEMVYVTALFEYALYYDENYFENSPIPLEVYSERIPSDGNTVLELGCGSGHLISWLGEDNTSTTIGIDLSRNAVQASKINASRRGIGTEFILGDAERLPIVDGRVDVVVCVDFLHHFKAFDVLVDEVDRILKVGGRLVFFEPNPMNPLLFLQTLSSILRRGWSWRSPNERHHSIYFYAKHLASNDVATMRFIPKMLMGVGLSGVTDFILSRLPVVNLFGYVVYGVVRKRVVESTSKSS